MKKSVLFGMVLAAAIILLLNSGSTGAQTKEIKKTNVTWTGDCDYRCVDGICNTIIGRTEWADEGAGCRHIMEIDDLSKTGKFKVVTESDGVHGLEVVKYNYSCVVLRPYAVDTTMFEYGKPISLKLGDKVLGDVRIPNIFSPLIDITVCPVDSALNKYSFGKKSTTVRLQDANTENLEDADIEENNPNNNYGGDISMTVDADAGALDTTYNKFFIAGIPVDSSIINATYYAFANSGYSGSRAELIKAYHVYNQTWKEEVLTFNNEPCQFANQCNATEEDEFYKVALAVWMDWDVTDAFINDFESENDNFSVRLEQNSTYYINFRTKEYGTAAYRPFVDVAYSVADITVDNNVYTFLGTHMQPRSLVWINKTDGYVFFLDDGAYFNYRKTTDAGATWGIEVTVEPGTNRKFAIWYDKWTKDDTGDLIHTAVFDADYPAIYYNSLNTSNDSLSGAVVVFGGDTGDTSNSWSRTGVSIVKARGGNIYVGGWIDKDGENIFKSSTTSPATSFSTKTSMADGDSPDRIMFLAGNEIDSNDIWSIYQDVGANLITLKVYNSSANAWSESGTIDAIVENSYFFEFDAMDRHSDGHAILVMWNEYSSATGDLVVWDIENKTDWTAKTYVVSNDDTFGIVGLLINQQNDDLYVAYSTNNETGAIVYQKSTDDGGTWDGETAMSETTDDHRVVAGGTSIGDEGGRWMPVWFNDDLDDLLTNSGNSIEIAAAAGELDVSFLVQYPDNNYTISTEAGNHSTIEMEFNSTTGQGKNVSACIVGNSAHCQTTGLGLFLFNNSGDTAIKWEAHLNESLPSAIKVWATLTSSHGTGIIPVNNSVWSTINASIPVSGSDEAWFWANFTDASVDDFTIINIEHNSTEV